MYNTYISNIYILSFRAWIVSNQRAEENKWHIVLDIPGSKVISAAIAESIRKPVDVVWFSLPKQKLHFTDRTELRSWKPTFAQINFWSTIIFLKPNSDHNINKDQLNVRVTTSTTAGPVRSHQSLLSCSQPTKTLGTSFIRWVVGNIVVSSGQSRAACREALVPGQPSVRWLAEGMKALVRAFSNNAKGVCPPWRILFFGTDRFAVHPLKALLDDHKRYSIR